MRIDFMVINLLPYELIDVSPKLANMCACISWYHQTVNLSEDGKAETLKLRRRTDYGHRRVASEKSRTKTSIVHGC